MDVPPAGVDARVADGLVGVDRAAVEGVRTAGDAPEAPAPTGGAATADGAPATSGAGVTSAELVDADEVVGRAATTTPARQATTATANATTWVRRPRREGHLHVPPQPRPRTHPRTDTGLSTPRLRPVRAAYRSPLSLKNSYTGYNSTLTDDSDGLHPQGPRPSGPDRAAHAPSTGAGTPVTGRPIRTSPRSDQPGPEPEERITT
ncbi:hypothetical protein FAIPA1_490015 [Frankia sp. AiPs1]